jgi:hypothetical protein
MNAGTLSAYWIVAAVAAYYVSAWLLVGRMRSRASIAVRYTPPDGLSPAAIRCAYTMGSDGRSYAAILAQLAAKKLLAIVPDRNRGVITLRKLAEDDHARRALPDEEARVFKDLFEWQDQVELRRPDLSAITRMQKILQAQPVANYFTRNLGWIVAGLALTAIATIGLGRALSVFEGNSFDAWLMCSFAGLVVATYSFWGYWIWDTNRLAFTLALRGLYRRQTLPVLLLFIVLYPALWYFLIRTVAPRFAVLTTLLILVNGFAAPALRNYTANGQRLRDEIEGFRRFLAGTEQDRLQRMNAPGDKAPIDLAMIPYAIALDLREAWGDELGMRSMVEIIL